MKKWFAVCENVQSMDDWSTGFFDESEAMEMAIRCGDGAVLLTIDDDSKVCVDQSIFTGGEPAFVSFEMRMVYVAECQRKNADGFNIGVFPDFDSAESACSGDIGYATKAEKSRATWSVNGYMIPIPAGMSLPEAWDWYNSTLAFGLDPDDYAEVE